MMHIDYRGHRFLEPFHCLCCGIEISARQFAWGRACGYCDCGRCQIGFLRYKEGHGKGWENIFAAPLIVAEEPEENLFGLELLQRTRVFGEEPK